MKISSKTINSVAFLNRSRNIDSESIHQVNQRFLEQRFSLTELMDYHRKFIDNLVLFGLDPENRNKSLLFLRSNLLDQIASMISYSNEKVEEFVICDMPFITMKVEIARFSFNTVYNATLSIPGWQNYLSDAYTPDQIAKIIIDLAAGRSHANCNQLSC
jgi:hypothetical protein